MTSLSLHHRNCRVTLLATVPMLLHPEFTSSLSPRCSRPIITSLVLGPFTTGVAVATPAAADYPVTVQAQDR